MSDLVSEIDSLYSTIPEYQARNPSSFPTERSLAWFVKTTGRNCSPPAP